MCQLPTAKEIGTLPKLRQWSVKAMESAMSAVKEGLMGINRAALEHDVPKTTLKDHLSSRVQHGKPISRAHMPEEEQELY